MHGGAVGSGRPIVHGRYSKVLRRQLNELYGQALDDEADYLDLRQELAFMRTLIAEYQGRFLEGISQSGEDVGRVVNWLSDLSKAANRASQIESRSALTARQVMFLEMTICQLLEEFLGPKERERFAQRLSEAHGSVGILLLSESISEDSMN